MANEQNLKPFTSEQSREEAKRNGRKGGIASGEAKRKRKKMKEQINLLLSLPLKDLDTIDYLEDLGVDTDNIDNQMAMICSLWQQALKGGKNAVAAATFLRDTVGEKPTDKTELVNKEVNVVIK
jgi:hypothetical protein